jgi:toxin CcdB
MPQYDVYPAPEATGYLVDVQTDLLDGLSTRVVVPLLPDGNALRPAQVLNPVFEIAGTAHVMATQFLSAVPASILRTAVGSLRDRSDAVTRALDMVFHGL